jgi:hypothetical protein
MTSAEASAGSRPYGDIFLSRFDWKVRRAGRLQHPIAEEEIRVERDLQAQRFRRTFGEVTQFVLTAGVLRRLRVNVAAVRLENAGLVRAGESEAPSETCLRQISAPSGLDFQDDRFYCVGVYSSAGWPQEWRVQAEIRGNAMFYLVEKGEGTCWHVYGPKGPFSDLFDPESLAEKTLRAEKALSGSAGLLSGEQVLLDAFAEEHHLDRAAVETALQTSAGRYQLIEHRGKSYVQRSTR